MTDLAEGYDVRAYVKNKNGEVIVLCMSCAEQEEDRREQERAECPYLDVIEEYEDSIHLVKDFVCEHCGGTQDGGKVKPFSEQLMDEHDVLDGVFKRLSGMGLPIEENAYRRAKSRLNEAMGHLEAAAEYQVIQEFKQRRSKQA